MAVLLTERNENWYTKYRRQFCIYAWLGGERHLSTINDRFDPKAPIVTEAEARQWAAAVLDARYPSRWKAGRLVDGDRDDGQVLLDRPNHRAGYT